MSFSEFIAWLGTSAALGVMSSIFLTGLKAVIPSLADKTAKIVSVILAGIACVAAVILRPHLANLPPWIEAFWPTLVWVLQQVWFELTKPKEPTA